MKPTISLLLNILIDSFLNVTINFFPLPSEGMMMLERCYKTFSAEKCVATYKINSETFST